MGDDKPAEILVVAAPVPVEGAKGIFGKDPAPVRLGADALKENMARFLESLKPLVTGLFKPDGPFMWRRWKSRWRLTPREAFSSSAE